MVISKMIVSGGTRKFPRKPHELTSFITADEDLFIITHVGIAEVERESFQLNIGGLADNPIDLSWDELLRMPHRSVVSFHKCAGPASGPSVPTPERVGNVIWTGVPLLPIMEKAGMSTGTRFVWATGADHGEYRGICADRYEKDIPIEKIRQDQAILAFAMNGAPISVERGGPLRLIVPGFYGTNSVKWVHRLTAATERSSGLFTTKFYNDVGISAEGYEELLPVWSVLPDSIIVTPNKDKPSSADSEVTVRGWAWGEFEIAHVELSLDDGQSWFAAELIPRTDYSWQEFSGSLRLPSGEYILISRATDKQGRTQSLTGGRNMPTKREFSVR